MRIVARTILSMPREKCNLGVFRISVSNWTTVRRSENIHFDWNYFFYFGIKWKSI